MSSVRIAWRDDERAMPAPTGTPAVRFVSVVVHVIAFVALLQMSGVPRAIVDQFDEPPLVVALTAPVTVAPATPDVSTPRPASSPSVVEADAPASIPEPATPTIATGIDSVLLGSGALVLGGTLAIDAQGIPDISEGDGGLARHSRGDLRGAPRETASTEPISAPLFDAAYLNNPRPAYPDAAARRGIAGVVVLRVFVSIDGRAESVEIEQSSGSRLLDRSAQDTVRTSWRFVPARKGDMPIAATVLVPVRFELVGR
ncbi:MAG: energy transducer TonB [Vicinamibacterales bacterium]